MQRPERVRTDAGRRDRLLARLRNSAREQGVAVARLQQRIAFERFLARLNPERGWLLKGGLALELRYGWQNRPTKDIDLRTDAPPQVALQRLQDEIATASLQDGFDFVLRETTQELQGAPGGTLRVRVEARFTGTALATFSIDLSSGDALVGEPDVLTGSDLLAFDGIQPISFPIYPLAQHLAEKLHAYTLPRDQENTRVKDLMDMAVITALDAISGDALMASVQATFAVRDSHSLPDSLSAPPASWAVPFRRMANETALAPSSDIAVAFARVASFWQPLLIGGGVGMAWRATAQVWQANSTR